MSRKMRTSFSPVILEEKVRKFVGIVLRIDHIVQAENMRPFSRKKRGVEKGLTVIREPGI